ncbi:MAG: carboxylating nicotinate-nucleotide diphosphorylase [Bacteroidia bacterium]|nr:carboxylating nicotinate-nucleotide diphosphorylase [Bacteroidia bacterium]MDW8347519.1 carboxylating nicotinate-nucleotide diphosphorylase [Bacteroidia bacterium]
MDFLHHPYTQKIIDFAFEEDLSTRGDVTTLATLPDNCTAQAKLIFKEEGIAAGIALAEYIFKQLETSARVDIRVHDGQRVDKGEIGFYVTASYHTLLKAERVVLNFMQRMSGIATLTNTVVQTLKGLPTRVLDTRKTTPGLRILEKWAVQIGGGVNYRFGLYDWVMIKDNHIDHAGGIEKAITRVQEYLRKHNLNLKITVETRNLQEVEQVLKIGGIDQIMFDNMDEDTMRKAVELVNKQYLTEASGNITLENARRKAETGVDFISMGMLTHSVKSLDISLKAML